MHRFKFTPDDLFVNRLKTYPEYNVFIYQGQMYVNKESRLTGSGGIEVYDINRSKDKQYQPFVVSGSDKVAFKAQKFQPLVKNYSGDHFNISKYAAEAGTSVTKAFYGANLDQSQPGNKNGGAIIIIWH